MIPMIDLVAQYRALKTELDRAVLDVLASGSYVNGPQVTAFEEEIAAYVGTRFAIALNSGTDSLYLALRALDVGPGDEVITSPFTFVATTEAIGLVSARPVFVDIDRQTYGLDASRVRAAITARTRAILPVHLYGAPVPMDELRVIAEEARVAIVEDCAQAIGARVDGRHVGSTGLAGCFSFFPSKNLGALGDGGLLVTDDEAIATRVRALRSHGGRVKYHHDELGINSRLDEIQAAILRVKLPHLDEWIARRRSIALRYDTELANVAGVATPARVVGHVYHQYTIESIERDRVARALAGAGIASMVYYPVPLHLQRVHAALGYRRGDFPVAERAAETVLSLPMCPELRGDDQTRIVSALRSAVARPSVVTSVR